MALLRTVKQEMNVLEKCLSVPSHTCSLCCVTCSSIKQQSRQKCKQYFILRPWQIYVKAELWNHCESVFLKIIIKGVRVIFLINYFINYTCGYCKKHVCISVHMLADSVSFSCSLTLI